MHEADDHNLVHGKLRAVFLSVQVGTIRFGKVLVNASGSIDGTHRLTGRSLASC
jgi:hypothetical protein